MGYKPDIVQKAKFEYSPLGWVLNKRLEKDDKQEGLLKRLENIEDKTDNQLHRNKDSQLGIKSIGYTINEKLSQETKNKFENKNMFLVINKSSLITESLNLQRVTKMIMILPILVCC